MLIEFRQTVVSSVTQCRHHWFSRFSKQILSILNGFHLNKHSVWINAQQIFQSSSFFSFILGRFGTLLTSASLGLDTNIWIFWEIFTKFDGFHKYLGFFFLKFYNAIVLEGFNPYILQELFSSLVSALNHICLQSARSSKPFMFWWCWYTTYK